jgi:hypothetical protein
MTNKEVKPCCSDDTDIVGKVACRQNKVFENSLSNFNEEKKESNGQVLVFRD